MVDIGHQKPLAGGQEGKHLSRALELISIDHRPLEVRHRQLHAVIPLDAGMVDIIL